MINNTSLKLGADTINRIDSYLKEVCMEKSGTVIESHTAAFNNGYEVDFNLVSCRDQTPFLDVILFDDDGMEIEALPTCLGSIRGEHTFQFDDDFYTVNVIE